MNEASNHPEIIQVGDSNFELEVLRAKQPVIVVFSAPWSRPCRVLDAILKEVSGRVKVVRINADDNPDFSLTYEVQSVPTLLYFVEGTLRGRTVGTASKEAILAKLEAVSHR